MNPILLRPGAILVLTVVLASCGKAPIEEAVQKDDRKAVSEALS